MKRLDWFDRSPKGTGWLHKAGLKPNELVEVNGHVYRYTTERQGLDLVLTPVEAPTRSSWRPK